MYDGMMGGMWMWGGMFLSLVFAVLLLALLVLLIIWLLRKIREGEGGGRDPDALEILRRRYAGGEISREEFERMRRELS